jgi:hypothetical protein
LSVHGFFLKTIPPPSLRFGYSLSKREIEQEEIFKNSFSRDSLILCISQHHHDIPYSSFVVDSCIEKDITE